MPKLRGVSNNGQAISLRGAVTGHGHDNKGLRICPDEEDEDRQASPPPRNLLKNHGRPQLLLLSCLRLMAGTAGTRMRFRRDPLFPFWLVDRTEKTAAARVRRATINEGVFMSSIPMSIHLEMGIVRERGASLNRSGVECRIRKVEMRNGMCRKVLQSGAALKAIVRSLEGKVREV